MNVSFHWTQVLLFLQSSSGNSLYVKANDFITVAILVLIIYFAVTGLLLYRRFMKRLFTNIDLSPRIFSRRTNLSRQIIRRIWMDTWTALLLCHSSTKMDQKQQVLCLPSESRPSQKLPFHGSIAERHLENLKIMRSIGALKFAEACHDLSPEEISGRQKVYNLYCGPGRWSQSSSSYLDCFYWPANKKIAGVTTWFGTASVVPFPFTVVSYFSLEV